MVVLRKKSLNRRLPGSERELVNALEQNEQRTGIFVIGLRHPENMLASLAELVYSIFASHAARRGVPGL
jgi:hypothetical protein